MAVVLKIIVIFSIIVACCMYLVIVGGNMNKTDEEKELENQEQMKFLQDNSKLKDYRHKNEVV